MFAGIVECMGIVRRSVPLRFAANAGSATRLEIDAGDWLAELALGSSIAVNGVCLTLAERTGSVAGFDVVAETLRLTNLGTLAPGDCVNLERSLRVGDRIDGHFVQGHVDGLGVIESNALENGEWLLRIAAPAALAPFLVRKGSITVDGVSLTIIDAADGRFSITLIPTTLEKTILGARKAGDRVNLETDVLARMIVQRVDVLLGSAGILESLTQQRVVRASVPAATEPLP